MKEKSPDISSSPAQRDNREVVLRVENLSKTYRLGQIGTGTISHDLNRWWAKVRGKEDPFATVGVANDRSQKDGTNEYVKVLNDINFEVKKGEVLGIIGKNGAGKSTLLKVISQITSPTTGSVKAKGRIASLLEVGTGMHPEMTGKENVYLNGTILGMTRKEIDAKFDEIMDFAGCAKYADTPVKRYSSGMKVRLGFAVAAFLEPEILIVDEVLAVGDAEFQKKAIGKMQDISKGDGRTVLFVSHNMSSIATLCTKTLWLDNGYIKKLGYTKPIVQQYLSGYKSVAPTIDLSKYKHHKCSFSRLESVSVETYKGEQAQTFFMGDTIRIKIEFSLFQDEERLELGLCVDNEQSVTMFGCVSPWENFQSRFSEGIHVVHCEIPSLLLLPNTYFVTVWIKRIGELIDDQVDRVFSFDILAKDINGTGAYFDKYKELNVYKKSNWVKLI